MYFLLKYFMMLFKFINYNKINKNKLNSLFKHDNFAICNRYDADKLNYMYLKKK